MKIVEENVKPGRMMQNREIRARFWWRFGETTPALHEAIRSLGRLLVCSLHQPHWLLAYLPSKVVFSHALAVFALDSDGCLCLLQSRPHEVWARFFASSMKDDMRYTPSDCFETFPFPLNFETDPTLESSGRAYYDFRAFLMIRNNEGLTKTYNRFHDPDECSPDILELRERHAAMDWAVLDAYGWTDLKPTCEFLLDYEDEEDQELATSNQELATRRRRKPWRYRWPDDIRDEVLARLLELNRQRRGRATERSRRESRSGQGQKEIDGGA